MFILNCTDETQVVKVHGNFLTFPPGKVKQVDQDKGRYITMKRKEQGLVELPEAYEDPEWRNSEEGKKTLEEKKAYGLDCFSGEMRRRIYNNQVSLRIDLEKSNIKADPAAFASKGEIEAMRAVAKYQKLKDDDRQKQIDEVNRLVEQTGTGKR